MINKLYWYRTTSPIFQDIVLGDNPWSYNSQNNPAIKKPFIDTLNDFFNGYEMEFFTIIIIQNPYDPLDPRIFYASSDTVFQLKNLMAHKISDMVSVNLKTMSEDDSYAANNEKEYIAKYVFGEDCLHIMDSFHDGYSVVATYVNFNPQIYEEERIFRILYGVYQAFFSKVLGKNGNRERNE